MRSSRALALTAVLACASVSHAQQWGKGSAKDDASSEGGSIVLLDVPDGWDGLALSMSADGSTIVGYASRDKDGDGWAESRVPLAWDLSGGYEALDVPQGSRSVDARLVTGKGGLILGIDEDTERAIYWLRRGDATTFASSGKELLRLRAISENGRLLVGSDDESFVTPSKVFPIAFSAEGLEVQDAIELEEGARPERIANGAILGTLADPEGMLRATVWDTSGRRVAMFDAFGLTHASRENDRGPRRYVASRYGPQPPGDTARLPDIVIYGLGAEPFIVHAGASSKDLHTVRGASDDCELLFGEALVFTDDDDLADIGCWIWTPELGLVSCDDAFDAWGIDREVYTIVSIRDVSPDGKSFIGECAPEGSSIDDPTAPFFVKRD